MMNKIKYIIIFSITASYLLLSGCSVYFKNKQSPALTPINSTYIKTYEYENSIGPIIIFIKNGEAISIADLNGVTLVNLKNNKVIKEVKTSDYDFEYAELSADASRYLLVMNGFASVYNADNLKLINQFKYAESINRVALSDNGKILYFGKTLWDVDKKTKLISNIDNTSPSSYDFSSNGQYFISGGLFLRPHIIDITSGEYIEQNFDTSWTEKIRFFDNNTFYIDYDTKRIAELSSFHPKSLGLYSIKPNNKLAEITPYARISCWTQLQNDGRIVMGLIDGDILVLDKMLNVIDHWSINDRVRSCTGGKNGKVWLGTESTGIFALNINHKTISHPVKSDARIMSLIVSDNEEHIAFIESYRGPTSPLPVVKVYSLPKKALIPTDAINEQPLR